MRCGISIPIALCFLAACQRPPDPAEWPTVAPLPYDAAVSLQKLLSRSELVFVGRLVAVDTGWTGYTGSLVVMEKSVTFDVLDTLKGSPPSKRITLQYVMFGKRVWVEEYPSGGIRLDPRFFVKGSEYVVIASRVPQLDDEAFYIRGNDAEGVWLNTPANLAGIRSLLQAKSSGGTTHPKDSGAH